MTKITSQIVWLFKTASELLKKRTAKVPQNFNYPEHFHCQCCCIVTIINLYQVASLYRFQQFFFLLL